MLELFTATTEITKSMKYTVSDATIASMTKFARSVWNMKVTSEIIYPYSDSKFFNNNQTSLTVDTWVSTVDGTYENMYTHFKNKKDAVKIFLGNFITEEQWLSKYFK